MRTTLAILFVLAGCSGKSDASARSEVAEASNSASKDVREAASSMGKFEPNDVVLEHTVKTLDGQEVSLKDYRGKALLVVNTASECGFTPQYAGLQKLYETYKDRGLEILAFPSNDFGGQEPGSNEDIRAFVDEEFEVTFAMFDKVHAKGEQKDALYETLTEKTGKGIRGEVKWNFTKFLVDPQGKVVARFESDADPTSAELIAAVEQVLPQG